MCFISFPNVISVNVQCKENYSYNPNTNDCSLDKNINQICNETKFNCNQIGEMNSWSSNPNIYYICSSKTYTEIRNETFVNICLPWWPCTTSTDITQTSNEEKRGNETILFPVLYRCGENEIFRVDKCFKNDLIETTTTTLSDEIPAKPFKCSKSGLFPDNLDCQSYYHCNALMRSLHLKCPTGTIFHATKLYCIYGKCI